MDEMMKKMMDQKFMAAMGRMDLLAEQHATSQKNISTAMDQIFAVNSQRAATGSLNLIPTGGNLPDKMLDYNATANQPANAPKQQAG